MIMLLPDSTTMISNSSFTIRCSNKGIKIEEIEQERSQKEQDETRWYITNHTKSGITVVAKKVNLNERKFIWQSSNPQ